MFSRDGTAAAVEAVLTLPIREADFSIEPGKGDAGECDFVRSVLLTPDSEGGMATPWTSVMGQITAAQLYRRSFFEKVYGVRDSDGKVIYRKLAYRPPATCQARYNDRTGEPNGFRQQVWLFGGNLMTTQHQKVPGYVDIPKVRSYIYTHGKHRAPLTGTSEVEVCYWALAYNSEVQTPNGPVPIKDIRRGDFVFGVNGKPTPVLDVIPRGTRMMYRVTFKDGTSVECDADHLWGVYDAQRPVNRYRVMSTADLLAAGLRRATTAASWRFSVPRCEPVEYPERDLPIDPYILGAWLGDGSIRQDGDGVRRYGATLACDEPDGWIAEEVRRRLPRSMKLDQANSNGEPVGDYHFRPRDAYRENVFRDALVELGVNVKSPERFVPETYLTASAAQRLDLLRGLMDSDGGIEKGISGGGNHSRYYTKSPRLAEDIQRLVRSLGGTAISRTAEGRIPRVEIFTRECPFLLPRKADLWRRGPRRMENKIVSIVPTEEKECRCITVGAEDGLFLTNDFIVTHNCYQTKLKLLYLWLNFLESQSMPRLIVYGVDQPEATRNADDISQLKASGIVGLPNPVEGQKMFEQIESPDAGQFFESAMNYLTNWQIQSVLAGFLGLASASTGGKGAYSLSQDQSDFYLKSRQAVAKEIAESISYDLIRPLVMLNFGSGAAYPQAKFGPLQDEQAQALVTMFGQMASAPVLHVPLQVFDLLTERMASILQLDVDQVHQALVSTASQRAEQLAGNPPPGMPPEAAAGLGQLQGLAHAGTQIAQQAMARPAGGVPAAQAPRAPRMQPPAAGAPKPPPVPPRAGGVPGASQ